MLPRLVSDDAEVRQFPAFGEEAYTNLDLAGLAAYALKRLQDLQIPTTFENIVVALFRLFPSKFALVGYPEWPDAARVGRTLLQLGPKYRNWARGSVSTGFILTHAGEGKASAIAAALVTGKGTSRANPGRPRTMDLSSEMESIERSALFAKWQEKKLSEGEPRELFDLLGAYAYAPKRALSDRLQALERTAKQLERKDMTRFLADVRARFSDQLRDPRG